MEVCSCGADVINEQGESAEVKHVRALPKPLVCSSGAHVIHEQGDSAEVKHVRALTKPLHLLNQPTGEMTE